MTILYTCNILHSEKMKTSIDFVSETKQMNKFQDYDNRWLLTMSHIFKKILLIVKTFNQHFISITIDKTEIKCFLEHLNIPSMYFYSLKSEENQRRKKIAFMYEFKRIYKCVTILKSFGLQKQETPISAKILPENFNFLEKSYVRNQLVSKNCSSQQLENFIYETYFERK